MLGGGKIVLIYRENKKITEITKTHDHANYYIDRDTRIEGEMLKQVQHDMGEAYRYAIANTRFQSRRDDTLEKLMSGGGCAAGTQPPAGSGVAYAPPAVTALSAPLSGATVSYPPPSAVVVGFSAPVVGVSALIDGSSAPVGGISAIVLGSPAPVERLSALVVGSPALVEGVSAFVEKSPALVESISTPNEKVLTKSKEMLNISQIQYITL
jgi:hypothetical protein